MYKKVKKIISKIDLNLYEKFGSLKSTKHLENLKEAQIIFSHLNESEQESRVRFVGGCVRKAISGEKIDDIDLATTFEPHEIIKKLNNFDIKVIETGVSHGTVTAIVKKRKIEITTLRKDLTTDGRHANVQFTHDWQQDALRRDFTINAIYADEVGRVFDPLNGIEDLKKGQINFIGSPDKRIKEDYLRILRYFRFFAQYSKLNHNLNIISLIKQNINGLNQISKERIFDELNKILSLKNIYNLFSNNISKEIILNIFPQFKYYKRLKNINNLNLKSKAKIDNCIILALLILDGSDDYEYFCHKYKTSNKIKERLKNISNNFQDLKKKKFYSEENIKKQIYFTNKNYVEDLLLFSAILNNKEKVYNIEKLIDYLTNCKIPKFPISGEYLKEHGYVTGETLGKKLKFLEEEWIKNNFVIDKKFLKNSLKINKN